MANDTQNRNAMSTKTSSPFSIPSIFGTADGSENTDETACLLATAAANAAIANAAARSNASASTAAQSTMNAMSARAPANAAANRSGTPMATSSLPMPSSGAIDHTRRASCILRVLMLRSQ